MFVFMFFFHIAPFLKENYKLRTTNDNIWCYIYNPHQIVPVLATSASYAISESFGWKSGLHRKFKQAASFYGIIIVAIILGIALNFIGLDSIKALIYSAVLNGIISPVVLFFILRISDNEKVMGEFKNKKLGSTFGWITFTISLILSILSIYFILW